MTAKERIVRTAREAPYLAIALVGGIALASWQANTEFVRSFTEVLPTLPWTTWLARSPGSFFVPSPWLGEPADSLIALSQTALTVGNEERRRGWIKTAWEAATFQTIGCTATRLFEVSGLLPPEKMHEPDVGPSAVTVAFATKYLVEKAREATEIRHRRRWYAGAAAVGLAATGGALLTGDPTSAVGHAAGSLCGWVAGLKSDIQNLDPTIDHVERQSQPL